MTTQLNAANLNLLDQNIQVPKYDRQKLDQSIMHVGVGGFHRAHQALYMDDLLHQGGDSRWGYCGVGLLKHDALIRDVMRSQDCLYTLVERSLDGDKARIVGSIVNFLFAPDDPQKVIEQMASPETRIISLTITEGDIILISRPGNSTRSTLTFNMISLIHMNPAVHLDICWRLSIAVASAGFHSSH